MTTRIVIGGLKGAGKSVFTTSLYLRLQREGFDVGLHEIDVYSDTHSPLLGHKPWEERKRRHHAWQRTVERRVSEFASDDSQVVIGDLPGKLVNPNMPLMVQYADVAIVLDRYPVLKDSTNPHHRAAEEWVEFMQARDIEVLATVFSLLPRQRHPAGTVPARKLDRKYGPNHKNPVFNELLPLMEPHLAFSEAATGRLSA